MVSDKEYCICGCSEYKHNLAWDDGKCRHKCIPYAKDQHVEKKQSEREIDRITYNHNQQIKMMERQVADFKKDCKSETSRAERAEAALKAHAEHEGYECPLCAAEAQVVIAETQVVELKKEVTHTRRALRAMYQQASVVHNSQRITMQDALDRSKDYSKSADDAPEVK